MWTVFGPAQWSTPMKSVGDRTGATATSRLSAPPPSTTSCAGAATRKWRMRPWAIPSPQCWSATSTPPTTTTTAPSSAAGRLPTLPGRPSGDPGQAVQAHRKAHQGAVRLRGGAGGAVGQQRCGKEPAPPGDQPEDQRRHPLRTGHRKQHDPGFPLRHLARPEPEHPSSLPPVAPFPSTLNCYGQCGKFARKWIVQQSSRSALTPPGIQYRFINRSIRRCR